MIQEPQVAGRVMSMKSSLKVKYFKVLSLSLALSLFTRDWKKVETHIGTRSGA